MNDMIHDCYVSITGKKPTNEQVIELGKKLPKPIVGLFFLWGPNDSEFRNKTYQWLKDYLESNSPYESHAL